MTRLGYSSKEPRVLCKWKEPDGVGLLNVELREKCPRFTYSALDRRDRRRDRAIRWIISILATALLIWALGITLGLVIGYILWGKV